MSPKPIADVVPARFRPLLPKGLPRSWTPLNPVTFLLKATSLRPQHTALVQLERNRSWTYLEWATRISNLVYALRSVGIKRGDRVLVLAPNTPMIADAIQGVCAMGAILVPINTRLTVPEVDYLVEHSGSSLLLVDSQFKHLVKDSKVPVVLCNDTGDAQDPYEAFLRKGADYDRKLGNLGWQGIEFESDENAIHAICYTSGTTSRPKGVELHLRGGYLAALANVVEMQFTPDSRYLWILPQFHAMGWYLPYACTAAMCTQYFLRQVGTYDEIWDMLLNHGITHYSGAPTVQLAIISHEKARRLKQQVTCSVAGSAPTPTLLDGLEKLNFRPVHVYGLTETYGPTTRNYFVDANTPDRFAILARQGAAFLTADDVRVIKPVTDEESVKMTEDDIQEVAFDGKEVGEILMRGNIVMRGYYKNEDATKKAFIGPYFRTGDLAVRFPDGTVSIQDRSKDLIISGGENVSSLSVETEIATHPDVHEVAVVAEPHPKWGERPSAFVVLKPKSKWNAKPKEFHEELKRYLKPRLAGFAIPESTRVVKELEKTSTGKVSKKVYRDLLLKEVKSKL